MEWVSLHIHYQNLNLLIKECIVNLIEDSRLNFQIKKYFFIRYGENGLHLRLRLYVAKKKSKKILIYLEDKIHVWLTNNPSMPTNLNNRDKIVRSIYKKEVERYGGEQAIILVEDQFQLSSELVFKALKEDKLNNYKSSIGMAIYLHLSFVYSVGFSLEETIKLFTYNKNKWLSKGFENIESKDIDQKRKQVFEFFENSYNQIITKNEGFVKTIFQFWELLNKNDIESFDTNIIKWVTENKKIITEIKNKLPKAYSNEDYYNILDSLIHMTNNRLGVLNYDESYISFIICKILTSTPIQ